jgi:hypothetical protein
MSHFAVLVLHRPNQTVDELLAPYHSELEGPEREKACICVEMTAWRRARAAADAAMGSKFARSSQQFQEAHEEELDRLLRTRPPDVARGKQLNEEWLALTAPWRRARDAALGPAMADAKPEPGCEFCGGTGRHRTSSNPNEKWDWYEVGGRYTGVLDSYDPTADPDNWETCRLCHGTGQRTDMVVESGCNLCHGSGRALKDQLKPHPGDTCPAAELPTDYTPYAVVTPIGEWYEIAQPGYHGMVWEEQWMAQVRDLLQRHSDCLATIADVHM